MSIKLEEIEAMQKEAQTILDLFKENMDLPEKVAAHETNFEKITEDLDTMKTL